MSRPDDDFSDSLPKMAPSRRSLSEDPTSFVVVPDGPPGDNTPTGEITTTDLVVPEESSEHDEPSQADTLVSRSAHEATAMVRVPVEELSVGSQFTVPNFVPPKEISAAKTAPRPPRLALIMLSSLTLVLVCFGLYSIYAYHSQMTALRKAAQDAVASTQKIGSFANFEAAQNHLNALLVEQPKNGMVLTASALVMAQSLYEFGGDAEFVAAVKASLQKASSENHPSLLAAQIFWALAQADSVQAGRLFSELQTSVAKYAAQKLAESKELAPVSFGLIEYLSSQIALLDGREDEAIAALRRALQKNPMPLWRAHLGLLLSRAGSDTEGEATALFDELEQHYPDLCSAQIAVAFLRGSRDKSSYRPSLAKLHEFVEPTHPGGVRCGRSERAWAALQCARLTLYVDPTTSREAQGLLAKAEALAWPEDLVFAEALARAWLRAGEPKKTEALSRAVLKRMPTRRGVKLLLGRVLLQRGNQSSAALLLLEPLFDATNRAAVPASPALESFDVDAKLLRARGLLQQNDIFEAVRLVRPLKLDKTAPKLIQNEARLIEARALLRLQAPAAAREVLTPLLPEGGLDASPALLDDWTQKDQYSEAQLLWAQALLAARPPEQLEARARLEAVIGQAPQQLEARLTLGHLLRELSEWTQAEQQLNAALRLDENYSPAQRELGALYMQRGEFVKARAIYRILAESDGESELVLAYARAQRLAGDKEQALRSLAAVKRRAGEVMSKYDEGLLVERARTLLALFRYDDVKELLREPANDLAAVRRPALAALFLRALIGGLSEPQRQQVLGAARQLLGRLPGAWRADRDVVLAESEILLAEKNLQGATLGLSALRTSLLRAAPTASGEELELRQRVETLLATLPPAPTPPGQTPAAQTSAAQTPAAQTAPPVAKSPAVTPPAQTPAPVPTAKP